MRGISKDVEGNNEAELIKENVKINGKENNRVNDKRETVIRKKGNRTNKRKAIMVVDNARNNGCNLCSIHARQIKSKPMGQVEGQIN